MILHGTGTKDDPKKDKTQPSHSNTNIRPLFHMMGIMQLAKTVILRCNNQMDDSVVGTIREKQYSIMEIQLQEQI